MYAFFSAKEKILLTIFLVVSFAGCFNTVVISTDLLMTFTIGVSTGLLTITGLFTIVSWVCGNSCLVVSGSFGVVAIVFSSEDIELLELVRVINQATAMVTNNRQPIIIRSLAGEFLLYLAPHFKQLSPLGVNAPQS